mmetsp:Transcript_2013/g.3864  ORF Transcript_2013/g.3864 Transcript_2013/m.3864 type:complete len:80 (-) Transcript_2013:475-714(-)
MKGRSSTGGGGDKDGKGTNGTQAQDVKVKRDNGVGNETKIPRIHSGSKAIRVGRMALFVVEYIVWTLAIARCCRCWCSL